MVIDPLLQVGEGSIVVESGEIVWHFLGFQGLVDGEQGRAKMLVELEMCGWVSRALMEGGCV